MSILRKIIRNDSDIDEADYFSLFSAAIFDRSQKHVLPALLAALAAKPLNLNDAVAFVRFIEKETPKRQLSVSHEAVNIVGTGGGLSTFNISTTATFVAAAAGAKVIKSGSYSYNSQCGSLDVLQHLGFNLNQDEQGLQRMLEELNIGFVSPGMYSSVLRRIAVSVIPFNLREIGGFINTLGPLLCPFQVSGQICGVRQPGLIDTFASAFASLGMNNSIIASAEIGLDEFSAIGKNYSARIQDGIISRAEFDPAIYGFRYTDINQLNGGTPETNVSIMESLLKSTQPSAARDTVILNAAYLLVVAQKYTTPAEAIFAATAAIESGNAFRLLHKAREFSHDHASKEIA